MRDTLQLDPPLRMETPQGPGWAQLHIWEGVNSDAYWVVFLDSGAIVYLCNEKVRAGNSYTAGRWNPGIGAKLRSSTDPGDADMRNILNRSNDG